METWRHNLQMRLLIDAIEPWLHQRGEGFVGGNMFVYFSLPQIRNQDFKGPDFFVVLDVSPGERKSWVVWEEGKGPDIVIELLSDSTAEIDKTSKKTIYEKKLKVGEYYWFDPFNADDLAGFLLSGDHYNALQPDERGYLISPSLELALVRWQGSYHNVEATWLRWATPGGEILPNAEEMADEQRRRAEAAEAELARLKAQLRK